MAIVSIGLQQGNGDVGSLNREFHYLTNTESVRNRDRSRSLHKIEEKNKKNTLTMTEKEGKKNSELKKVEEMVQKIKRTALYIRLVNDKGTMRAHVINRITHRLVAVIPWYIRNNNIEVTSHDKEVGRYNIRSNVAVSTASVYNMKGNPGMEVDTEV